MSFCSNTLFAQATSNTIEPNSTNNIVKYSNNGKLNYSYRKLANNHFSVDVIFKNDQFIYKQEIDTLQIQSAEAFKLLKKEGFMVSEKKATLTEAEIEMVLNFCAQHLWR